ncbi:response regulator [Acanthopleuribacter pedis]|uniref:Response regulator n=1 Tax=Acanthopleuribacter pedis TaxID=442870 RepID=A0A8J7U5J1_9BACT|nr:response regulator [Acanthopleuribacter pedis]MBO1321767.1 response regulator [Acanthopleuribacter pedis]
MGAAEPRDTAPILIVEDSPDDFMITRRALRRAGVNSPLYHCVDGTELRAFLQRRPPFDDEAYDQPPLLLLLDLNLPGEKGHDLLAWLKADPATRVLPVIILTTSIDERDVQACYARGANSFIKKNMDFNEFVSTLRTLGRFWFDCVALPQM